VLVDALEHLVRGIVANPDDVDVSTRRGRGRGTTLDVRVHPDDMGRVIGRAGRTATALRTVVGALSKGGPVRIDFVDVDGR
jgi:hypothetical protein